MDKRKISKFVLKNFLYVFILILILSANASALVKKEMAWKNVENKNNTLVYTLKMYTHIKSEYLEYNEFILNDEIHTLYFRIINYPSDISLIDFSLRIISPNGIDAFKKNFSFTRDSNLRDYTIDLKLNETGTWYWNLYVKIHKNGSFDNLGKISLIQYNHESQEFNNNSIIEVLYNNPLEIITFNDNIEFPDGFRVYTQSEAAQIISARALEEAAKYQQQTVDSYKDNLLWQQIMVGVLLATAVITLVGICISGKRLALSSKEFEELIKERKRPIIIKIIVLSMEKILNEFNEFSKKISKINNKNKPKEIINLESGFREKILSKQSNWKDFKRRYPELYENIMHYLNDVDDYTRLRNKCKEEIISKIREIEISEEMNKLVKKSQGRNHGTSRQHLEIDLAPNLAESILSKEGMGYLAPGARASELFEKYYDFWMKIREEKTVYKSIKVLSNKLKDIAKYGKLTKKIEEEINKLMEDYDIHHTQLDDYRQRM